MSFLDALFGKNSVLITGVEQDPDEPDLDRVYIGPRWKWQYVLASRGAVALGAAGHCFTTLPPDAPVYEDVERREAARPSPENPTKGTDHA